MDTSKRNWSRLTVPNDLAFLPMILDFVRGFAGLVGLPDADARRVELAVEETAANVIGYAYAPDETADFDVVCRHIPKGLEVTVRDHGLPLDPSLVSVYEPKTDLGSLSGHGLGRFLIRQLMDEWQFRNLGRDGKETRLTKYLETPAVVEEGAPGASALPMDVEPAAGPAPARDDLSVRWMMPEEAVQVSRCVYDSYGYSYANEHLYYPDRVRALNESGDLRSAVAVTAAGEIGGHIALIFDPHLPPEIGVVVTKKPFRGAGVAQMIGRFLDDESREMGLAGLHSKQVTVHPYTQKFLGRLGFKDCGLLLAHSPKTVSFKGIADELEQRLTDIVCFKYLSEPEPVTIYPPERHAEMIVRLYANLGAPAQPTTRRDVPSCEGVTTLDVSVNSFRALAQIHVGRWGDDAIEVVRTELRRLQREEIRVMELFISLTDPVTAALVPALEEMGFFFTGILPRTWVGDAMIMQYFDGVHVDYDRLSVVSDAARELLAYVRGLDPDAA